MLVRSQPGPPVNTSKENHHDLFHHWHHSRLAHAQTQILGRHRSRDLDADQGTDPSTLPLVGLILAKKKHIQVTFEPGCFDDWDGTQEELDALVAEITRMAESGELASNAVALDDEDAWQQLSQEEQDIISQALDKDYKNRLN